MAVKHTGKPGELGVAGAMMVDCRDGAATAAGAPDIHSANAIATSRKSSAISRRPTVMTNVRARPGSHSAEAFSETRPTRR